MNDGPVTYKSIASYLTGFTERISAAQDIQQSTETCTQVDPKSIAHLKADGSGGLPVNGFVCYDRSLIQEEYLQCPDVSVPAPTDDASSPSAPTPSATAPTSEEESSDDTMAPSVPGASSDDTAPPSIDTVPTSSVFDVRINVMMSMAMMMMSAVVVV